MKPFSLAKAVGVSHVTIGNYLSGNNPPKSDHLRALAEFFAVSMDELFTGEDRISRARKIAYELHGHSQEGQRVFEEALKSDWKTRAIQAEEKLKTLKTKIDLLLRDL